jgi:predicted ABC-type ATPase
MMVFAGRCSAGKSMFEKRAENSSATAIIYVHNDRLARAENEINARFHYC